MSKLDNKLTFDKIDVFVNFDKTNRESDSLVKSFFLYSFFIKNQYEKYRILNVFNKNPKKLIIAIDNKNESSILKLFLILIFKRGNQMKKVNLYIESMPEDGITQAPDTISAEYDNGVLCFYYFNDDKTEVAETDTESGESELKEFKSLLSESDSGDSLPILSDSNHIKSLFI